MRKPELLFISYVTLFLTILQFVPNSLGRDGVEIFPMDVDYLTGSRDDTSLLKKYSKPSNLCARDWIRTIDTSFPGLSINSCEDLLGCYQEKDETRRNNMLFFRSRFWYMFALAHNYCLHCGKDSPDHANMIDAIKKGYCELYVPCSVEKNFFSKKSEGDPLELENDEMQCLLFPYSADRALSSEFFAQFSREYSAEGLGLPKKSNFDRKVPKYISRHHQRPHQIMKIPTMSFKEPYNFPLPLTQRFTYCKHNGRFGFGCGIYTNLLIPAKIFIGDFIFIPFSLLFCYCLVVSALLIPFCCEDIQFQMYTAKNRVEAKRGQYFRQRETSEQAAQRQGDEDYSLELQQSHKVSRMKRLFEFAREFFSGSPSETENIPYSRLHDSSSTSARGAASYEGIAWRERADYFGVPPGKLTAKKLKFRIASYLCMASVICFWGEIFILFFFWLAGPIFKLLHITALSDISPSQNYTAFVRYPTIMFNMMIGWSYSLMILIWIFMSHSKEASDNLFHLRPHILLPKLYRKFLPLITTYWVCMLLLNLGAFCFQFAFSILGWNFAIDFYNVVTAVPLIMSYAAMVVLVFVFGFKIMINSLRYDPKLKIKHIRFTIAMLFLNLIFIFEIIALVALVVHSLTIFRADSLTRFYALIADNIVHFASVISFIALVYIGFEWKTVTFLWDWDLDKNFGGKIDPSKIPMIHAELRHEREQEDKGMNLSENPQGENILPIPVLQVTNEHGNPEKKNYFDAEDFAAFDQSESSSMTRSEIDRRRIKIAFSGQNKDSRIQVDVEPQTDYDNQSMSSSIDKQK